MGGAELGRCHWAEDLRQNPGSSFRIHPPGEGDGEDGRVLVETQLARKQIQILRARVCMVVRAVKTTRQLTNPNKRKIGR